MYSGATRFPLIAIPLFILAGTIMNTSGISQRLVAFASALFGFVRGGLAMVSISASMFFAEISGSAVADVAAMGSILVPAMKRRGYSRSFAAAVTSSSATLAVIIPPSIPMILYGVMSGSSVVELFVAGIRSGRGGRPSDDARRLRVGAPGRPSRRTGVPACKPRGRDLPRGRLVAPAPGHHPGRHLQRLGDGDRRRGSGGGGGAGDRRASVYRELDMARLRKAILECGRQSAVVMLLVAASALLGDFLTEARAPQQVAAGDHRRHRLEAGRAGAPQRLPARGGTGAALGGGDHPGRARS